MDNYSWGFKPTDSDSEVVAKIRDGEHKDKLIYLNKSANSDISNDKIEILYEFLMSRQKNLKLTQRDFDSLVEDIISNTQPEKERLKAVYKEFNDELKKSNEISLKENEIEIVPYQGSKENIQRDVIFISACSGAGKTTWIANYAKYFNKLYPRSPIFLFSSKPIQDEKQFEKIKRIKQINLNEKELQEVIDNGSYQALSSRTGQSLVIFDDFDAVPNSISKLVDVILNSVLQVGRSKRVYTIVSKHSLNAGLKTKIVWSEANKIVLFPYGLSRYALHYAMKNYIGLDKHQIEKILSGSNSRWVMIHTHLPKYVITQNSLYFLK